MKPEDSKNNSMLDMIIGTVSAVTSPIVITNMDFKVLFINERLKFQIRDGDFSKSMGVDHENDLYKKAMNSFIPELNKISFDNDLKHTIDFNETSSCTGSMVSSGNEKYILIQFKPKNETQLRLEHCQKEALLKCKSNIMMVNEHRRIIYFNHAMHQFLSEREEELRKVFPDFRADNILGANIDGFHSNPRRVEKVIEDMKDTHVARLELGDFVIRLIFNPLLQQ